MAERDVAHARQPCLAGLSRDDSAVIAVPDFGIRGARLASRGCDDLVGTACVLSALDVLRRRKSPGRVIGLLNARLRQCDALLDSTREGDPRRAKLIEARTWLARQLQKSRDRFARIDSKANGATPMVI